MKPVRHVLENTQLLFTSFHVRLCLDKLVRFTFKLRSRLVQMGFQLTMDLNGIVLKANATRLRRSTNMGTIDGQTLRCWSGWWRDR